jgi:hypothetical protein
MPRARQTIAHLPVEQLTGNPANVRDDLGDLTDLARSILELGVLEPLLVTEHPDGGYLLLDGHRRLGAGGQLGLKSFPVIIRHDVADTAEQIVTMLATDVHKKAFTPMQRARAYGHLRDAADKPPRGRPRVAHFGRDHALAPAASAACRHKRSYGSVACGPCWEQTIRDDAIADAQGGAA